MPITILNAAQLIESREETTEGTSSKIMQKASRLAT